MDWIHIENNKQITFVLKEKGEVFFEIEDGKEDNLLSIVDRQGIYKGIIKKIWLTKPDLCI